MILSPRRLAIWSLGLVVSAAGWAATGSAPPAPEASSAAPSSAAPAPEASSSAAPSPSPAPAPDQAPPVTPGRVLVGKITGQVVDASRRPVAGLMVQLKGREQRGLLRVTGTAENGAYAFADLPPGSYDLEVGGDRFVRQTKSKIEVRPPFRNIVDFVLPAAPDGSRAAAEQAQAPAVAAATIQAGAASVATVPVRGRLLDGRKRPVVDASVTFVARPGGALRQTFSDDDGRFLIEAMSPGRYRILVASPGHVPLDLEAVEVPAGTGLDLSLALVDHPLNFKGRQDDLLPHEETRPPQPPPADGAAPPGR